VEEVRLVLVLPESLAEEAWDAHGNEATYEAWVEETGPRTHMERPSPEGMPLDLLAVAEDPFTFRESIPVTGAIQGVQLPDIAAETEWVAAQIKREILVGQLAPDEIAVVARDMGGRAEDLEQVFETMGVPIVSSREISCCDIPVVRAVLAWARLEAYAWRTRDLVAVAESPYLHLGLNPTLLARIGSVGTLPSGAEDWRERIRALADVGDGHGRHAPGSLPAATQETSEDLRRAFHAFCEVHQEILAPVGERTPELWARSLLEAVRRWRLEDRIYGIGDEVAPAERALLARTDLDGLNALLRAVDDWLRGREIAGLSNEPMSPALWYAELEAVARETRIRSSTYPLAAVHLLTPQQAALRSFRHVYIIGLTDGVWPAHSGRR
jgi:ATP-dependent helicase/DNAse subunit B